jgi:hypothetical protein
MSKNSGKSKLSRGFESASELYRSSDRCWSAKLVPTLADRGCHVVTLSKNVLFNANKHVFHCENSLRTLFCGQPSYISCILTSGTGACPNIGGNIFRLFHQQLHNFKIKEHETVSGINSLVIWGVDICIDLKIMVNFVQLIGTFPAHSGKKYSVFINYGAAFKFGCFVTINARNMNGA